MLFRHRTKTSLTIRQHHATYAKWRERNLFAQCQNGDENYSSSNIAKEKLTALI